MAGRAKRIGLQATATATSEGPAQVAAEAQVVPDTGGFDPAVFDPAVFEEASSPDWEVNGLTWSVDATVVDHALPRVVVQRSSIIVWVDNKRVPSEEILGAITVNRDRAREIQDWSFQVRIDPETGRSTFGNPVGQLGSPLGKRPVTIEGAYELADDSVIRIPLITNGVAHASHGESDRYSHVETHSGVDLMGRLSRFPVEYVKAPGQGIRRDEAIRAMFEQAGATEFALEQMRRTNKSLQYVDADAAAASGEIAEPEGRTVQISPGGEVRNPKLRDGRTPQWTLRESDLFAVAWSPPGDVVTRVTVNGTEYVAGEGEPGCPAQTDAREVRQDSIYAPLRTRWEQESDCSITDNGSTTRDAALTQTRVTTRTTVKRCGVLVAERVEVWEWHARETYRYERDGVDLTALACRSGARFLDGNAAPTANGSEPAVAEHEVWRKVRQVDTQHFYDLPGWQLGNASLHTEAGVRLSHFGGDVEEDTTVDPETRRVTRKYVHRGSETAEQSYFGAYLGSVTTEKAWLAPRERLKEKPASFDGNWEAVEYEVGVEVFGGGDAVDGGVERWETVRAEVEEVHSGGDRRVRREVKKVAGWAALPGGRYLYGDGKTYADSGQEYRHLATDETVYVEQGESSHAAISSRSDLIQPGNDQVTTEERDGDRPAANILPFLDEGVIEEIIASGGEEVLVSTVEAAMERFGVEDENRAFSIPVTADRLEQRHWPRSIPLSAPMVEDEREAEEYGKRAIAESAAIPVTLQLPLNALMDETDAASLHYSPLGLAGRRVDFRRVSHEWADRRSMPVTTVEGRIYLDQGAAG